MVKNKNRSKTDFLEVEMHKLRSGQCILDVLKQEKNFCLRFRRLNDKKKGLPNAFSAKNLTSNHCLVNLEVKLQENKCACCIYQ